MAKAYRSEELRASVNDYSCERGSDILYRNTEVAYSR